VQGSVSGSYIQPVGTSGNYFATGFSGMAGTVSEEISLTGLAQLSWFVLEVDWHLQCDQPLQRLDACWEINGDQVASSATGDQTSGDTNRYVNIISDQLFDRIEFVTASPAFEVDDLALTAPVTSPVREASTWAMMLVGFLGMGMLRRLRPTLRFFYQARDSYESRGMAGQQKDDPKAVSVCAAHGSLSRPG